jgi:glycogen(starch) synthase
MQALGTSDYRGGGYNWRGTQEDEDDGYPLYVVLSLFGFDVEVLIDGVCSPLVMKVRSRSGSVMSGASTPGGGTFKSLSEGDLQKADAALSQVNGVTNGHVY